MARGAVTGSSSAPAAGAGETGEERATSPGTAIVRRDREACSAGRHWELSRRAEVRRASREIDGLLAVASPACAVAAKRVVRAEEEFRVHRSVVLDGIAGELPAAPAATEPVLRDGAALISEGRLAELGADILRRPHVDCLVSAAATVDKVSSAYAVVFADSADRVADTQHLQRLATSNDVVGAARVGRGAAFEVRPGLEVVVGTDLLDTLLSPLSLLLESLGWFTSAGAALFHPASRDTGSEAAGPGTPDERALARLTAALQERWADILLLDTARSRVTLRADVLRDRVADAFAVPRPGPRTGVDVSIGARDVDAVRAGDFQWVLGGLRVPGDDREAATRLVRHFRPLPALPHTPRVTIDRLVVSPERWRQATADLAFAFVGDQAGRFLRAQEWRRLTGVPRFVFVDGPWAPFFVDLESLPSVEQFAHAVRALDREEPGGLVGVSEMLPAPGELWLTDARGARYTAEFRFVAVDRRGPAPGGRS
jgi:hypothetical protein